MIFYIRDWVKVMSEKKQNFAKYLCKLFVVIIFISFLTLYFSQKTGYFEYEQYKKTSFTKEQIEKFEQDIKDGKEVDITNYLDNKNNDYSNKVSKLGLSLSKGIEKTIKSGLNKVIDMLNNALS